jgi:hypothetical protein
MTHGICNRPAARDAAWQTYDNRHRFLRADRTAMLGAVIVLAIGAAYEYSVALHALFAPALPVLQAH